MPVIWCTCVSPQQDAIHGKGQRVFNKTAKEIGGKPTFRCTVCGIVKEKGGPVVPAKKK